jgi:hypothetical protein
MSFASETGTRHGAALGLIHVVGAATAVVANRRAASARGLCMSRQDGRPHAIGTKNLGALE